MKKSDLIGGNILYMENKNTGEITKGIVFTPGNDIYCVENDGEWFDIKNEYDSNLESDNFICIKVYEDYTEKKLLYKYKKASLSDLQDELQKIIKKIEIIKNKT